jgi:hypothetical protein
MSIDLDDLLDPARLAALWSKPVARSTPATPATPAAPAAPAAPASAPRLVAIDGGRAASPEPAQPRPQAPIDVHAHLRELVRAIDDELGPHFDPTSPPRRALDAHVALLRARLATAGPAEAPAPAPEAAAEILPLLDQIEDLLEALLRAGPWNA